MYSFSKISIDHVQLFISFDDLKLKVFRLIEFKCVTYTERKAIDFV